MKDDFKVQRVAAPSTTPPTRAVEYRAAPRRVAVPGRDVAPTRRAAGAVVPAATPLASSSVAPASATTRPEAPVAETTAEVRAATTAEISAKVEEAIAKTKAANAKKKKKNRARPLVGGFFALAILGVTGYVAFDTWISNNVVEKTTASTAAAVQGQSTSLEGSDENVVSTSAIESYVVAADMPRVLTIDSIDVRARILQMGVTASSAIQAPINIFDSGWYTGSAKPGTPGISFIDAHASGATREGLFAYLDTLKAGNIITVERGDGTVLKYAVRKLETKKLSDINMSQVLSPQDGITEGLTLMTCTGKWMADEKTYDQRAIVYAERI
ncbi:MAG: sortase domain-containing protein [Candidatus Microsaccharimonas sp.]